MNSQVCTHCHISQPETEFSVKKRSATYSTRNTKCKACQRKYTKKAYDANPEKQIVSAARNNLVFRKRNKDYVMAALADCTCAGCETTTMLTHYAGGPSEGQPVGQAVHCALSVESVQQAIDRSIVVCKKCLQIILYEKGMMDWGFMKHAERLAWLAERKAQGITRKPKGHYTQYIPRTPAGLSAPAAH
ncbi:MAG: hypothetical protein Q7S87_01400 [Agitococcus sp.]|nr:hypothetical protein [Agitococcus sp.]MDO9177122.1 hypothetical protein [Agitococcus sp.]